MMIRQRMKKGFVRFSTAYDKPRRLLILLTHDGAYTYWLDEPNALSSRQVIKIEEISLYLNSLEPRVNLYWALAHDGYQIVQKKHRFGSTLLLSNDTLQLILSYTLPQHIPRRVFAIEELSGFLMKKLIQKESRSLSIALSEKTSRSIEFRYFLNQFWGIKHSKVSVQRAFLYSEQSKNVKLFKVDDLIAELEDNMKQIGKKGLMKIAFFRALNALFNMEIAVLLLLLLLTPLSFLFIDKRFFHTPNASVYAPPKLSKPQSPSPSSHHWTLKQLSKNIKGFSDLLHPFESAVIQSIDFSASQVNMLGYWREQGSMLLMQQEWQKLLVLLNQEKHVRQVQVLHSPLEGDLSKKRFFRIKLTLGNRASVITNPKH